MKSFRTLDAIACPLPLSNVDTDQLIPARFMKRSRADGYGRFLLHDLRFDENGGKRTDCPLNHTDRQGVRILVARRNFGSGSSREAAVYALVDYGIDCVIAPSFGDIFASNAVNNGLLPAILSEEDCESLLAVLAAGVLRAHVDLEALRVEAGTLSLPFSVDAVWRKKLLNGWDDIDFTQSNLEAISDFMKIDRKRRPWMQVRPRACPFTWRYWQ